MAAVCERHGHPYERVGVRLVCPKCVEARKKAEALADSLTEEVVAFTVSNWAVMELVSSAGEYRITGFPRMGGRAGMGRGSCSEMVAKWEELTGDPAPAYEFEKGRIS